jgi:hypothetical protein
MGKNCYIYLNPASQKLVWIPWDLDLSFGGYFFCGTLEDRINLSIRHPFSCRDPLVGVCSRVKEFHDAYRSRVEKIVSTSFRPEKGDAGLKQSLGNSRRRSGGRESFRVGFRAEFVRLAGGILLHRTASWANKRASRWKNRGDEPGDSRAQFEDIRRAASRGCSGPTERQVRGTNTQFLATLESDPCVWI